MKSKILTFRDWFDILMEIRFSSLAKHLIWGILFNGSFKEESQESASLGKASIQTPEDSNQIDNICDCCQKSDIP